MSTHRLATQLFVLRTLGGAPDRLPARLARDCERALRYESGFVGVAVNGSRTRGYSLASSDVDLKILFDSRGVLYNSSEYWALVRRYQERAHNTGAFLSRRYDHVPLQFRIADVNPHVAVLHHFPVSRLHEGALLLQPATGPGVECLRSEWLFFLSRHTAQERTLLRAALLDRLVSEDFSEAKLCRRSGLEAEDLGALMERRRHLWSARVRRIWPALEAP